MLQRMKSLPFVPVDDIGYAWEVLKPTIPSDMADYTQYYASTWIGTRTRPELNFTPVPKPVPPVKSGTGTGTRLCHRYQHRYQALSQVPEPEPLPEPVKWEYDHNFCT